MIEGTTRKLLWSSTALRTCLTTMLQENTSSGQVATRTQRLDSLAPQVFQFTRHDFENFISTADLVLLQTETIFITTPVQKYKMIFDIILHIWLHIRTEMSEQRTTPVVIEGTARKLLWSSTALRTRLTTILQENTSSGHVATRTQQLDSSVVELIIRSSSSHHDFENFISTADLVLIQTETIF